MEKFGICSNMYVVVVRRTVNSNFALRMRNAFGVKVVCGTSRMEAAGSLQAQ